MMFTCPRKHTRAQLMTYLAVVARSAKPLPEGPQSLQHLLEDVGAAGAFEQHVLGAWLQIPGRVQAGI